MSNIKFQRSNGYYIKPLNMKKIIISKHSKKQFIKLLKKRSTISVIEIVGQLKESKKYFSPFNIREFNYKGHFIVLKYKGGFEQTRRYKVFQKISKNLQNNIFDIFIKDDKANYNLLDSREYLIIDKTNSKILIK